MKSVTKLQQGNIEQKQTPNLATVYGYSDVMNTKWCQYHRFFGIVSCIYHVLTSRLFLLSISKLHINIHVCMYIFVYVHAGTCMIRERARERERW